MDIKNPEHNLYIKENRLMLDDNSLFTIKPNGQVEPNQICVSFDESFKMGQSYTP